VPRSNWTFLLNFLVLFFADACVNVHCEFGARCEAGECVCPEDCHSSNSESVCASDGRTYGSECEMQRAACSVSQEISVVFYGECKESLGKYTSRFSCNSIPHCCRFDERKWHLRVTSRWFVECLLGKRILYFASVKSTFWFFKKLCRIT